MMKTAAPMETTLRELAQLTTAQLVDVLAIARGASLHIVEMRQHVGYMQVDVKGCYDNRRMPKAAVMDAMIVSLESALEAMRRERSTY